MRDEQQRELIDRYFELTGEVLPRMAVEKGWSALEDSHFQRIVLDHVAGGVWYGRIKEPAILNLSKSQLRKALRLCEGLADGTLDFEPLNEQSLLWRETKGVPPGLERYRKQKTEDLPLVPEQVEDAPVMRAQILEFKPKTAVDRR